MNLNITERERQLDILCFLTRRNRKYTKPPTQKSYQKKKKKKIRPQSHQTSRSKSKLAGNIGDKGTQQKIQRAAIGQVQIHKTLNTSDPVSTTNKSEKEPGD